MLDDVVRDRRRRGCSSCSRGRAPPGPRSRGRRGARGGGRRRARTRTAARARGSGSAAIRRASAESQYAAASASIRAISSSVAPGYLIRTCARDVVREAAARAGRRAPAGRAPRRRSRSPRGRVASRDDAAPRLLQAGDAADVVAVGAALELGERREGEAPHAVRGRRRDRRELGQARRRRRRARVVEAAEERELARLVVGLGSVRGATAPGAAAGAAAGWPRSTRTTTCAPSRSSTSGASPGVGELRRVEAGEHPADRRRRVALALLVDRAGDDQAVDRARHGDVVEAAALLLVGGALGLLHRVVVEGGDALAGVRMGDAEAEAPVRKGQDLVARPRWRARGRHRRRRRP